MRAKRRDIGQAGQTLMAAGKNLLQAGMAATAAGQVITRRMAMGAAAMRDPAQADLAEFTRMFTEKAIAVLAANQIAVLRSAQMAQNLAGFAMTEAALAAIGTARPFAWHQRMVAQSMAMGHLAVQAQGAVLAPLYRTVGANAKRLSRR